MIQKIVDALINTQLEKQVVTSENEKIYRYGYILLCEVILNLITAVIIGLIFGELKTIFFFLIMYIPLRSFCGGWHANKIWKCTIILNMILLLQVCSIRFILKSATKSILSAVFVICIICILYVAPVDTATKKISENQRLIYKKRINLIIFIHLIAFAVLVVLDIREYMFSLVYVYIIQNAMLILELIKNKSIGIANNK